MQAGGLGAPSSIHAILFWLLLQQAKILQFGLLQILGNHIADIAQPVQCDHSRSSRMASPGQGSPCRRCPGRSLLSNVLL